VSDAAAPRPWRCFVAVPLPAGLRTDLADWVAAVRTANELDADWRWTDPDGWHITLAFLGATPPEAVAGLLERLAHDLHSREAFTVAAGGFGAFPSRSHARVLWYGIRDAGGRLGDLAAAVRATTGIDDEARFRPHVTLARARDRRGTTVPSLPVETMPAVDIPVRDLELMRSHLGHGPARYESLGHIPLLTSEVTAIA